jgi:hypothetical protein
LIERLLPLGLRDTQIPTGIRVELKNDFASEFASEGAAQVVRIGVGVGQRNDLSSQERFGSGLDARAQFCATITVAPTGNHP